MLVCACGSPLLNGCKSITGKSDTPLLKENRYTIKDGKLILDLAGIPELDDEGGAVKLNIPSRDLKMIVARNGKNSFIALRDQCTHMGREIEYDPENTVFRCVSFGHSKYDESGHVIKGPAKSGLEMFTARLSGKELSIRIV